MLSNNELREIYVGAKGGDTNLEEKLFQLLRVRFSAIAKQRLKEDYSEDIAHDACLTVLEKYKNLSDEVEFEPWAYKVLRNKIGSYMRDSKLRNSKLHYSDSIESLGTQQNRGENIELKLKILSCLEKMSVYNLKYFKILNYKNQGYSTEEISKKLNIKPNHLYVILHRCRTLLYDCIYNSEDNL